MSTGTPMHPRKGHAAGDAEIEPIWSIGAWERSDWTTPPCPGMFAAHRVKKLCPRRVPTSTKACATHRLESRREGGHGRQGGVAGLSTTVRRACRRRCRCGAASTCVVERRAARLGADALALELLPGSRRCRYRAVGDADIVPVSSAVERRGSEPKLLRSNSSEGRAAIDGRLFF